MSHKSFLQEVEDSIIDLISVKAEEENVDVKVGLYHGDANSRASLDLLISRSQHSNLVLVGLRGKSTASDSTSSTFRKEVLDVDIYVCASGHRSPQDTVRSSYPVAEMVERALTGYTGFVFSDTSVKEHDAVSGGGMVKLLDLPDFVIIQMPYQVHVNRELQ